MNVKDRAILLPTVGDPFLLNLWFNHSYKHFKNEIDHVYMVLDCNHVTDDNGMPGVRRTKEYLHDKYSNQPGVSIAYSKIEGLGGTLVEIFDMCKHPEFGIIQDDAFVYRDGEVGRCFDLIEQGKADVVGTPMYCYSGALNGILDKVTGGKEKFLNELGYAFWQNFFFTTKQAIEQTDKRFGVQEWAKDTYIDFLKATMPQAMSLDMMASVSFQLRALKKRCYYVGQFLSTKDDYFYPIDVNFWQHVTTLSGIFWYMAMPVWENKVSESIKIEMERRVAWWKYAFMMYPTAEIPNIGELYNNYGKTINKIEESYKLNKKNIEKRMATIHRLFNL